MALCNRILCNIGSILYKGNLSMRLSTECLRFFSDKKGVQQALPIEDKIKGILKRNFPSAEQIEVQDVSGGCGAMFEISVVAGDFKGLTIVKQHRLVNEALKEEIKDMHGLRIHTALPTKPS